MMPGAIEIHLPGLDKWKVVRNGKSLALPNIVTVQHASVLTADQNSRVCNLRIRAAARDKRERQNRESTKRRDDCFHSSSAKMPYIARRAGLRGRAVNVIACAGSIIAVRRRRSVLNCFASLGSVRYEGVPGMP